MDLMSLLGYWLVVSTWTIIFRSIRNVWKTSLHFVRNLQSWHSCYWTLYWRCFFVFVDLRISRILLAPEVGFAQPSRFCWKFVVFWNLWRWGRLARRKLEETWRKCCNYKVGSYQFTNGVIIPINGLLNRSITGVMNYITLLIFN